MEHSSKKTNRKVHKTSMANFKETTDENGFKSVVAFIDGNILGADQNNKHYDEIISRLWSDDLDGVVELFSPEHAVAVAFAQLSADVKIEDGIVYFRGEAVNKNLGTHLIRLWEAGESYKPVVKFLERLYNNPQPESREMLWDWISTRNLTICKSGHVIGYKGVRDDYSSSRKGEGDLVNGEPVDLVINAPGNVVEKARDGVEFNPEVECGRGLHIGDFSYAKDWAGQFADGKIMEVLFDPRDVVSISRDAQGRKIRSCRYKVLREVKQENPNLVVESDENVFGVMSPNDLRKAIDLKADTTKNHLSQKRDRFGRFVK